MVPTSRRSARHVKTGALAGGGQRPCHPFVRHARTTCGGRKRSLLTKRAHPAEERTVKTSKKVAKKPLKLQKETVKTLAVKSGVHAGGGCVDFPSCKPIIDHI